MLSAHDLEGWLLDAERDGAPDRLVPTALASSSAPRSRESQRLARGAPLLVILLNIVLGWVWRLDNAR